MLRLTLVIVDTSSGLNPSDVLCTTDLGLIMVKVWRKKVIGSSQNKLSTSDYKVNLQDNLSMDEKEIKGRGLTHSVRYLNPCLYILTSAHPPCPVLARNKKEGDQSGGIQSISMARTLLSQFGISNTAQDVGFSASRMLIKALMLGILLQRLFNS